MFVDESFYFGWMLYNSIFLLLMLIYSKQISQHQKTLFFGFFVCLFMILAILGNAISPDHMNYRELVNEISSTKNPFVHVEEFYIRLIHSIGNNFFLYLCCIYIPQLLVFYWIFKHGCLLKNTALFLFLFVVLVLYDSIVGRYFLFNVIYLSGIVLLVKRRFLLGVFVLFLSFFLHKLSYIALPLIPLFFLPWRWNKKRVILAVLAFASMVYLVRNMITNNLAEVVLQLHFVEGVSYLERTEGVHEGGSLWWQIINMYQICVNFLLAFWVLYHLRQFCFLPTGSMNRVMYNLLMCTSMTSLFFYALGLPDSTIAYRSFTIGMIPLCYLLSLLPQYMHITKVQKVFFFWICLFYMMFNNAYIVGVSHYMLR